MNAPLTAPFPMNPTVGQVSGGWCWNGSAWVPSQPTVGQVVSVQVFTSSGTYMPSAGLTSCTVETIGGGGCGGGAESDDANGPGTGAQWVIWGGGGGSGGYSRKTLPAALVMGGIPVTVGAGGLGVGPTWGGSDTTFGALCIARGGGGAGSTNNTGAWVGQPGAGGAKGVGDVTFSGAFGAPGGYWRIGQYNNPSPFTTPTFLAVVAYQGGAMWGGNITDNPAGEGGYRAGRNADDNSGAGGEGALVNQVTQAIIHGGNGGSGICIVTEYCWAQGGSGPGGGCAPVPITDGSCGGWGGPWR